MDAWGWRWAFGTYAVLHLVVCLPIHLRIVPRRPGPARAGQPAQHETVRVARRAGLRWLTAAIAAASFVSSVVAVHVVSLLAGAGLTQAQAIGLAMLIGPMQVAGRLAELGFAARIGVLALGSVAFGLLFVAMLALLAADGFGVAAVVFVVAFGWGNGLFTITRGTTPAELYGREGLGALLGALARAGLYSRALAPASFSGMLAVGLTRAGAISALAVVALAALGSYLLAARSGGRPPGDDGPPS